MKPIGLQPRQNASILLMLICAVLGISVRADSLKEANALEERRKADIAETAKVRLPTTQASAYVPKTAYDAKQRTRYYAIDEDHVAVGYLVDGIFYQWRGVRLPEHWVAGSIRSYGLVYIGNATWTREIDIPLDYVVDEDGFGRPGYYDVRMSWFYAFSGVRFDIHKVDMELFAPRRLQLRKGHGEPYVRYIDVPPQLKDLAEKLNQTRSPSNNE